MNEELVQEVFEALGEMTQPVGAKALAEYVGLSVLDVSKAAHKLLKSGLVTKDRDAKYSVVKQPEKQEMNSNKYLPVEAEQETKITKEYTPAEFIDLCQEVTLLAWSIKKKTKKLNELAIAEKKLHDLVSMHI